MSTEPTDLDHGTAGGGTPTERRRRRAPRALALAAFAVVLALVASACVVNGTWTAAAMVAPPPSTSSWVDDVSCGSASSCLALMVVPGTTTSTVGAQRWDGSAWTTAPAPPVPAGTLAPVDLQVSCGTATSCGARMVLLLNGRWEAHFARWDGTAWQSVPLSSTTPYAPDSSVSCVASGACMFLSGYVGAVVWDGAAYTTVSTSTTPPMATLSCVSTSACTGFIGRAADAWAWDGTTWTAIEGLPQLGEQPEWMDLSCAAATDCLAVGTIPPEAHETFGHPLAARWDGSTWWPLVTPDGFVGLHSVSCSSTFACVAVGYTVDVETETRVSSAMAWNGDRWYTTPAPPIPAAGGALTDIGCATGAYLCMGGGWQRTGATTTPYAATYTWTNP